MGSGTDGKTRIDEKARVGDFRIATGSDGARNGSSCGTTVNLSPSLEGMIVWA